MHNYNNASYLEISMLKVSAALFIHSVAIICCIVDEYYCCVVDRHCYFDMDMSYTRVLHIKVAYRVPHK
jgi:hypothetical protein